MDQWSPVSDAVPPAPTLCPGASAVRQISPRVADAVLQAFNNHRLMGIRQKILLILDVVLVVSLTIHGWLILEEQREEALADLQHRGSDISHFLAKAVACSVIGYDYHPLQLLMNEIVATDAGILKNTMAYISGRDGACGSSMPRPRCRPTTSPRAPIWIPATLASWPQRTRNTTWSAA